MFQEHAKYQYIEYVQHLVQCVSLLTVNEVPRGRESPVRAMKVKNFQSNAPTSSIIMPRRPGIVCYFPFVALVTSVLTDNPTDKSNPIRARFPGMPGPRGDSDFIYPCSNEHCRLLINILIQ